MSANTGWFEITQLPHAVTLIREPYHAEDVKSYLVEGERNVAVLDTGTGAGDFHALARELSDREPIVLQSHAHWDHVGAASKFERVLIHPAEADELRAGYGNERMRAWFAPERAQVD